MSDTLPEREDQMTTAEYCDECKGPAHAPGCSLLGAEEAGREVARRHMERDGVAAAEHQVTKSGACAIPGCPCRGWSAQETAGAIAFVDGTLRDVKDTNQLATTNEHEPAARGGGDEWYYVKWYEVDFSGYPQEPKFAIEQGETLLAVTLDKKTAEQILAEHKQHQSLVAERERLMGVLQLTEKMLNYILELSRIDHIHTQAQQGIKAINDAFNQQRSTPQ